MQTLHGNAEHKRTGSSRRILDQQAFASGLFLLSVSAFAWWAASDLVIGVPAAMGPGMMPRITTVLLAVIGALLVGISFIKPGPRLTVRDFGALIAAAALGLGSLALSFMLDAGNAADASVGSLFCILYVLLMLLTVWLRFRSPETLARSGLRGPVFLFGGVIAFVVTIGDLGLLVAAPLLALISGASSPESRPKELVVFALVLTLFCALVFKTLLNLPIPLLTLAPLGVHY